MAGRKQTPKETPVDQSALTIEEAAEKIERAVDRLRSGRLNDRAIIVLIQDDTGLSKSVIKTVLDSIGRLPSVFLKKAPTTNKLRYDLK